MGWPYHDAKRRGSAAGCCGAWPTARVAAAAVDDEARGTVGGCGGCGGSTSRGDAPSTGVGARVGAVWYAAPASGSGDGNDGGSDGGSGSGGARTPLGDPLTTMEGEVA